MILELTVLGVGARYWLKRRHRRRQQSDSETETASAKQQTVNSRQLLRDVRSAMLFTEREQLLMDMDPELREAREKSHRALRKQLHLSLGALGVTVLAAIRPLFFPLGVAAILYLSRENYKLIWRDFKRGHYLSFYLVSAVMNIGMIVTGHLILSAFNGLVFGFLARITNQLEETAQDRLINIFSSHPEQVWVLQDGVEIQVDFHTVQAGDRVIVNAGEVIPVDGKVSGGIGQVDQHMLTGESQPIDREVGEEVFASTLLIAGRLEIEVVTAGERTVAKRITQVLDQNNSYKNSLIMRGREVGDRFIPVKFGLAGLALPMLGPNAAMAVMWANLGNGLATIGPMIVMTYMQLLARQHILVKDGRVFESLRDVDTIVFDKTGTLTEEQPSVGKLHALNGFDETEVLGLAAAAECRQSHPIARAIMAYAKARAINLPAVDEASYEVGFGIRVRVQGQTIRVGSARFLQHEGIEFPASVSDIQQQAEEESHSLVYVGINAQLAGILEMQPTIRAEAVAMVQALKQRGLQVYIISGDHEAPTRRLAEKLGIEHYFAETLPEDKAELVKQLRDEGRFVCFVGDGINDAIALQSAQVSVSLKGASSAATDTAQIIFMDGTLQRLLPLFELVDEFEETMRRATVIGFTPGTFTVAGVFFWHFDVVTSLMILYLNICAGLSNTLWPMVRHQQLLENPEKENKST